MKRTSAGRNGRRAAPATSRAAPTKTAKAAPSLREARASLDNLEEGFDEAALHLLRQVRYQAWSAGPVVPLPAADLGSGELGWARRLERPSGAATVELRLFPGGTAKGRRRGEARALTGVGRTLTISLPGAPVAVLSARSETPRADPKLSRFLTEFAEELQKDDED